MAHSTSGAPSERNATSASNHTSASADAQTSPRPRKAFPLRFIAGVLAHWQIIASAVLLGGGVAGLAATYDDYCGMTELSYAPAALRSDFEEGSKVSGFRPGVMAAQIETESHWRVGVESHQGAKGIAQFTDEAWNAEHYSFGNGGNVLNPHDAIAAQARYLSELRFKQAKLSFVNGVTPAMAGVHADGTPLSAEESASAAAEVSASASASASARPSASASSRSSAKPSATGR